MVSCEAQQDHLLDIYESMSDKTNARPFFNCGSTSWRVWTGRYCPFWVELARSGSQRLHCLCFCSCFCHGCHCCFVHFSFLRWAVRFHFGLGSFFKCFFCRKGRRRLWDELLGESSFLFPARLHVGKKRGPEDVIYGDQNVRYSKVR